MRTGASAIPQIVNAVYADLPDANRPLAELSVLAHLEKLEGEGRVTRAANGFKLT